MRKQVCVKKKRRGSEEKARIKLKSSRLWLLDTTGGRSDPSAPGAQKPVSSRHLLSSPDVLNCVPAQRYGFRRTASETISKVSHDLF